MDIYFVGGIIRVENQNEIIRNSRKMPYFAADAHQKAIIEGLEFYADSVTIVNSMHLASYPRGYRKALIRGSRWSHNGRSRDVELGYINIFAIRHIVRIVNITIGLLTSLNRDEYRKGKKKKTIVSYGLHLPFLVAAFLSRSLFKRTTQWCAIIPEIPKFYIGTHGKGRIYNFLKKIDWTFTNYLLKRANSYELITGAMAEFLKIEHRPFVVVEAIIRQQEYSHIELKKGCDGNLKTIIYTGTTAIEFGIEDLLRAFGFISGENYRLMIFGGGSGDRIIQMYSKTDARIFHMGFRRREDVLEYQRDATLLVNPRRAEGEYTKYSFPSKTLEYMLSGNPVIMHKLDGIPDEYSPYVKYFSNRIFRDMAMEMQDICEWSDHERLDFGSKARDFVLNSKNEIAQGAKLFGLIEETWQ